MHDPASERHQAALTDAIDALLPQTQCRRCGYDACRPYAAAVAAGGAEIDRCPPGGAPVIAALARLLGRPARPLAADVGPAQTPALVRIRAADCIGCAKCLPACPVDAIVGARKYLHSVLEDECTGCELCIAPCPVDCIELQPRPPEPAELRAARAARGRERYQARQRRLAGPPPAPAAAPAPPRSTRSTEAEAAMARARALLARRPRP